MFATEFLIYFIGKESRQRLNDPLITGTAKDSNTNSSADIFSQP
jgi:hypothetical protein